MKIKGTILAVLLTSCMAFYPVRLLAQVPGAVSTDSSQRLQALEAEIEKLRAEVAELKAAEAAKAAAATATSSTSAAAPSAPSSLGGTTMSAFVDGYYGYNFNQTDGQASVLRAFDTRSSQFSLNMAELIFDKTPSAMNGRLGYRLALGFGDAMNAVNASDPAGPEFAKYLKEAYFSYLAPAGKGLQLDFGKFVTPHGAEVIESKDNWNYSRGLLFSYAIPYYHFGLRAKYAVSDKVALTGYVVNGWNNIVDNNTGKTFGATFAWTPSPKFSLVQNYMTGPEGAGNNDDWRHISDTLVTIAPTSKLTLAANFDYGRNAMGSSDAVYWTGIAGYLRYAFNNKNAFTTRYEYYNDHDGFTTGMAQHLNGVTATYEHAISNKLITRFEYRHDESNRPVFLDKSTPVTGQDTVAVGVIYVFDSKEPE